MSVIVRPTDAEIASAERVLRWWAAAEPLIASAEWALDLADAFDSFLHPHRCPRCRRDFTPKHDDQRYCGRSCAASETAEYRPRDCDGRFLG